MSIYSFAREFEKESQDYYYELAEKTNEKGLKNILTMLAGAEAKHLKMIESLEKGNHQILDTGTDILGNARQIFKNMKGHTVSVSDEMSQTDLYKKALILERESHSFYTDKADTLEPGHERDVLFMLAEEEKKHAFLIENIIEFVQRPQTWIEDAEFYHLDEY